jgi:hypothetical protein
MFRYVLVTVFTLIFVSTSYANSSEIKSIYFDFASDQISTESKAQLTNLVADLGNHTLTIYGYADFMGNHSANFELSKRRIESVQNFLVSNGFPDLLISNIIPEGESKAMLFSEDIEKNVEDRRVDIHVEAQNFTTLNDLHQLCQQRNKSYFFIKVGKDSKLVSSKGHKINIPYNYFEGLPNGKTIKVEVTEANDLSDFFIHRLSTITDKGEILETRGMLSVQFYDADNNLPLDNFDNGNDMTIEMKGNPNERDFELFVSDNSTQSVRDWTPTNIGISNNNRRPLYKYNLQPMSSVEVKFDKLKKPINKANKSLHLAVQDPAPPNKIKKPYLPTEPNYAKITLNGKMLHQLKSEKKRQELQQVVATRKANYEAKLAKYHQDLIRYEMDKVAYDQRYADYQQELLATDVIRKELEAEYYRLLKVYETEVITYLWELGTRAFYNRLKKGSFQDISSASNPQDLVAKTISYYAFRYQTPDMGYITKIRNGATRISYYFSKSQYLYENKLDDILKKYGLYEPLLAVHEQTIVSANDLTGIDNFLFSANRPNWYNIDRYYKMGEEQIAQLRVKGNPNDKVYVKILEDNVFLELNYNFTENGFLSPPLPKNKELQVITTSIKEGVLYFGVEHTRLEAKSEINGKMVASSLKEMLQKLDEMGG